MMKCRVSTKLFPFCKIKKEMGNKRKLSRSRCSECFEFRCVQIFLYGNMYSHDIYGHGILDVRLVDAPAGVTQEE